MFTPQCHHHSYKWTFALPWTGCYWVLYLSKWQPRICSATAYSVYSQLPHISKDHSSIHHLRTWWMGVIITTSRIIEQNKPVFLTVTGILGTDSCERAFLVIFLDYSNVSGFLLKEIKTSSWKCFRCRS